MNLSDKIQTFLLENGHRYKEVGDGKWLMLMPCPRCRKENKFYINAESGSYVCHKCKTEDPAYSGNAIKLLCLLGDMTEAEAKTTLFGRARLMDYNVLHILPEETHKEPAHNANHVAYALPPYFKTISGESDHEAVRYLLNRGISKNDITTIKPYVLEFDTYKEAIHTLTSNGIGFDEAKDIAVMAGRVCFPVVVNGVLHGLIARDYTGLNQVKVLNTKGLDKASTVFNLDNVTSSTVVVSEGVISAIKCGLPRAIATQGKVLTKAQVDLIKQSGAKRVVINLDVDAHSQVESWYKMLSAKFDEVLILNLPKELDKSGKYKDTGDFSYTEVDAMIKSAITYEEFLSRQSLLPYLGIP